MPAIGCGLLLLILGLHTVVGPGPGTPGPAPPRRARAELVCEARDARSVAAHRGAGASPCRASTRVSGRRPPNVPLPGFLRQRRYRTSDVVFAPLATIAAGMFVVFVTLLLTV
jgi:hypothetical protein